MIAGFIRRKFSQVANLPVYYRVVCAAAVASPIIRTVTTPYMIYDIYTDMEAIEGARNYYAAWAAGEIRHKLAFHGAVWGGLQAVQWMGFAYIGRGLTKHSSATPATQTP